MHPCCSCKDVEPHRISCALRFKQTPKPDDRWRANPQHIHPYGGRGWVWIGNLIWEYFTMAEQSATLPSVIEPRTVCQPLRRQTQVQSANPGWLQRVSDVRVQTTNRYEIRCKVSFAACSDEDVVLDCYTHWRTVPVLNHTPAAQTHIPESLPLMPSNRIALKWVEYRVEHSKKGIVSWVDTNCHTFIVWPLVLALWFCALRLLFASQDMTVTVCLVIRGFTVQQQLTKIVVRVHRDTGCVVMLYSGSKA